MPGEGYNPYRDTDGKFASGPGGGPAPKQDRPVSERRTAPTWPRGKTYEATSSNVKDHAARTRFHAHRAEFFAHKASVERDPAKKKDLIEKAKTSATHAATCARRATRSGPGTVGALRAKEYAAKAREHANRGASSSPHAEAQARADAVHGTPSSRAQSSAPRVHSPSGHNQAKVDAALKAIDENKSKPMATTHHKNFTDPRGVAGTVHARDFEKALRDMSGKAITVAEISHGFAVPDGYKAELTSLSGGVSQGSARVSFTIRAADGSSAGVLNRQFDRLPGGGMKVYHELFKINEEHQSKGISDHVNGNALRNYEKWGVKKAAVTAAGVGRYAWNRMGFGFNEPSAIIQSASRFIDKHPHLAAKKTEIMAEVRLRASKSGPHSLAAMDIDGDNPSFTGTGPGMKKVRPGSMRFKDTYNGNPSFGEGGKIAKHGFTFGQAVLLSNNTDMWSGTLPIDRNNDGYLHAISKTSVAKEKP